jgi:hypothetical protein
MVFVKWFVSIFIGRAENSFRSFSPNPPVPANGCSDWHSTDRAPRSLVRSFARSLSHSLSRQPFRSPASKTAKQQNSKTAKQQAS